MRHRTGLVMECALILRVDCMTIQVLNAEPGSENCIKVYSRGREYLNRIRHLEVIEHDAREIVRWQSLSLFLAQGHFFMPNLRDLVMMWGEQVRNINNTAPLVLLSIKRLRITSLSQSAGPRPMLQLLGYHACGLVTFEYSVPCSSDVIPLLESFRTLQEARLCFTGKESSVSVSLKCSDLASARSE